MDQQAMKRVEGPRIQVNRVASRQQVAGIPTEDVLVLGMLLTSELGTASTFQGLISC